MRHSAKLQIDIFGFMFCVRNHFTRSPQCLHTTPPPQGATRALVVKFADVKKAHTAKGWMGPDGRGASPLGFNGGMRHANVGGVGGYWAATAPGGRDVFSKGREVYPDYVNRGYPYQVGGEGAYACVASRRCVAELKSWRVGELKS